MRIIVQNAKCQGHARCAAHAPHIFKLDDAGYILPGNIEVAEEEKLTASRGARSCPERALKLDLNPAARVEPDVIPPRVRRA